MAGLGTLVASWLAAAGTAGAAIPTVQISAPKGATETLPVAPVSMHANQIINRSGKLIRIFIQDDGKGHGGHRLLEQMQN